MREFSLNKLFSIVLASLLVVLLAISTLSCRQKEEASEKVGVVVTVLPQAEYVESVGGKRVNITVMVPPGANVHIYEPTPSQMTALAKAEMYAKVGSGVEFELVWMDKLVAANKKMLVIDCSTGVQLQKIAGEHRHEHSAIDPHIWTSPLNAQIMVQNICGGLVEVDPDNSAYYEQNRDIYLQKLAKLDQDIRNGLSRVASRTFMVYHPAFGYFARDYNLTMLPVEEEGKEPTAAGLAHLIKQAKEHNIKVVFAEPQFNPQSAKVIADAIGGKVVFINPLAKNYIVNLRLLLRELVQATE
ncbi:High-affinity zinc uptake system binding-protein ZnuA [subsurface metagenome]